MKFRPIIKDEMGQVLVTFALLFVIIVGFLGLAVDTAYIVYTKQKLQHAVDLSVLAAVSETVENHGQVESTAIDYARRNGVNANELKIKHPFNSSSTEVELTATRNLDLFFLPLLGFKTVNVSANAVAKASAKTEVIIQDRALDYAVFSGSTGTDLQIKGNGSVVTGNVHGNKKVALSGSHTINGNLTSRDGASGDLSRVSGTVAKVPEVPMPQIDFASYEAKANKIYTGNQIFNNLTIDGIFLVNGSCTLNGGRIRGNGVLLVTGDVTIATSNFTYSTADDLLAVYTNGNIHISASNSKINGLLYAPLGEIRINGSGNTVYGAIIGNSVIWATKDTVINANYDIRVPQALTISKYYFSLIQ